MPNSPEGTDRPCFGFYNGTQNPECRDCHVMVACRDFIQQHGFDLAAAVLNELAGTAAGTAFELPEGDPESAEYSAELLRILMEADGGPPELPAPPAPPASERVGVSGIDPSQL